MDFEQSEQTRRLVVVTALNALSKIYMNKDLLPKIAECEKELRKYAFPLEVKLWATVIENVIDAMNSKELIKPLRLAI